MHDWMYKQRVEIERLRYGAGQHDLLCESLGVGKGPDDPGPTLFERVMAMQAARDEAHEAARWLYEAWSCDDDQPVPLPPHTGSLKMRWPWLCEVGGD